MFTVAKGFIIGAGMIIPIGAQNSYVLSQAIKKNFHFTAATICILCDFLLMSLGVFGGGALVNSNEYLYYGITWGGILFLSVYGALFFRDFIRSATGKMTDLAKPSTRRLVIFTTLAVTLLNPHVYLDTVVIIGSISSQYSDDQKLLFLLGTALASLTWFYALSSAAAKMSPWLSKPNVQRGINLFVALIMWSIAISLLVQVI
ncbi:LysE/ArgO family amino acid transporter [Thalassotalea euphylliae]|uniref:LysE/ArgO family amino acid transporter n=1 Tax=Thalassotalea euphylliae TaxID=1655234 RepID=UPI00363B6E54